MSIFCSVCGMPADENDAAILAISRYGNPRYLCKECEKLIDTATLGKDYTEIAAACDALTKAYTRCGKCDEVVTERLTEILDSAAERGVAIKEGRYDFSKDDEVADDVPEDIPEELLESEEDKLLDEKEARLSKKLDKIITWVSAGIIVGIIIFFVIKFFG